MRAGFARTDITPDIGASIPGGFAPRVSTGVHDPLQVRACVMASADRCLAVVGVDAVSLPAEVVQQARSRIDIPGLSERDILIAASHTHCGGPSNDVLGTGADREYQVRIAKAVAKAVQLAWQQLCPVTVSSGVASCDGWAFNRRWVMPDGSQQTNPGKGNPEIVKAAGPVDPEVITLGFRRRSDGVWLGAISQFTCHCTLMSGSEFSADYPAFWRDALAQMSGNPGFCMVFLNGACGDINQLNVTRPEVRETGEAWAREMGTALAGASWNAICEATPIAEGTLDSVHGDLIIPYRQLSDEQLAEAEELTTFSGEWTADHWLARDRVLLQKRIEGQSGCETAVDLYRIDSVILAAAPWQPFCQFGLRVKACLPIPAMVVSFANGSIGYVPTPEGLAAGGYEPRLCRGSCLVPEAGSMIVSEMCRLAPEVLRSREEESWGW